MSKGCEQTFFQRRYTNGQQTHENILNITNYEGNENQKHSEISPPTCQFGCYQKEKREKVLVVRIWRKGNPCVLLVGMCYKLVQPLLLVFSLLIVSNSLQPHRLQHARLLCPLSPGFCSNSCPNSCQWSFMKKTPYIKTQIVLRLVKLQTLRRNLGFLLLLFCSHITSFVS